MPVLALGFILILVTIHLMGRLPIFVLMIYIILSITVFILYGVDKSAATRRGPRTRERTLHLLSLFGGWPGAVLAQSAFRHKRSKRPFQRTFKVVCAINAAVLMGWLILR